jgi:hypothetical protein
MIDSRIKHYEQASAWQVGINRLVAVGRGAIVGLLAAFAIRESTMAQLDMGRLAALGAIDSVIIGAGVLGYMAYCHVRKVGLKISMAFLGVALFVASLVLTWQTDRQLGWFFGLFLAAVMAKLINMALIGATLQSSLLAALGKLWTDSVAMVGGLLGYLCSSTEWSRNTGRLVR